MSAHKKKKSWLPPWVQKIAGVCHAKKELPLPEVIAPYDLGTGSDPLQIANCKSQISGPTVPTNFELHRCPKCGAALQLDGKLSERELKKVRESGLMEGRIVLSVEKYKCIGCRAAWPVSEERVEVEA